MKIGRIMFDLTVTTIPHVEHGPQEWPWWKLLWIAVVRTNPGRQNPLVPCWQVWIYTRWAALVWWCGYDKRPKS